VLYRMVLFSVTFDQCDKLVTVVGHQFIALTVDICVQHGGRDAVGCHKFKELTMFGRIS